MEYQGNNGTISSYLTVANGSSRQLVLSGLNASLSYHFLVRACTINQHYCTPSTIRCTVFLQDPSSQAASWNSIWFMDYIEVIAAVGGAVFFVTIILIVYFWKKWRKWSSTSSRLDLDERLGGVFLQQSECPSSQSTSDEVPEYCDIQDSEEKSESSSDCALLPDQRYIQ